MRLFALDAVRISTNWTEQLQNEKNRFADKTYVIIGNNREWIESGHVIQIQISQIMRTVQAAH